MHVVCHVHGLTFRVPCGDGEQDMRWLGLAAAQRYALMKPRGRSRMREEAHSRRGFHLPADVVVEEGTFTHPGTQLKSVLSDGAEVWVSLQHEVEVDEVGTPTMSRWASLAFCHSEVAKRRQAQAEEAEQAKLATAAQEEEEASKIAEFEAQRKAIDMRMAMTGALDTLEDVASALEFDWGSMKIADVVPDKNDRDQVRELLTRNFVSFNQAFHHYSGVGPNADHYSMSFMEAGHFIHLSGLYSLYLDTELVEGMFRDVNVTLGEDPFNPNFALLRHEFLELLVRLAKAKHGDSVKGGRMVIDCVQIVMDRNLRPAMAALTAGPVREMLASDEMNALFHEFKPKLVRVYLFYTRQRSDQESLLSQNTLSLQELAALLNDAGLLEDAETKETEDGDAYVVSPTATRLFHAVQNPPDAPKAISVVHGLDEAEAEAEEDEDSVQVTYHELVFVEFLEAVCRLALEKFADQASMSNARKVRLAVNSVADLAQVVAPTSPVRSPQRGAARGSPARPPQSPARFFS